MDAIVKQIYEDLRKYRGSIKDLSKITGYSRQTIKEVLKHNSWKNDKIVNGAIELIKKYRAQEIEKIKQLKKRYKEVQI